MIVAATILLVVYLAIASAYWLWTAYGLWRTGTVLRPLEKLHPPAPQSWPRLSVVVPACNEADAVEAAVRTLLAADYPDLEIVLVDDRSTDGTSEILDRLAAEDRRIKVLHITELPAGWIGKVHALHCGYQVTSGDLILFTDADVHFKPLALRQAVAWMEHRQLGHLAAIPRLWPSTLLVEALLVAVIRMLVITLRFWKVEDPASPACMGVGAFNLVRRTAFAATPGFEWLRLEPGDDVGLGLMMKRSGARCAIVSALDSLGLYWYRTLGEVARGMEKGYASAFNFSPIRAVVASVLMLLLETSPLLALVPLAIDRSSAVAYAGLVVPAVFILAMIAQRRWTGAGWRRLFATPFVAPVAAVVSLRAGVVGYCRGGAMWRGVLYTSDMLRGGKRVHLP